MWRILDADVASPGVSLGSGVGTVLPPFTLGAVV